MSPNLLYIIGIMIITIILTKSFISASVWLAIPYAYYITLDMDIRKAILILVIAGIYSQLVILWKSSDVRRSETIPRR